MCSRQLDFDMRVTYAICIPLTYAEEAPSPSHGFATKIVDMLAAEKQKGDDKNKQELKVVLSKYLSGLHDLGQSSSSSSSSRVAAVAKTEEVESTSEFPQPVPPHVSTVQVPVARKLKRKAVVSDPYL